MWYMLLFGLLFYAASLTPVACTLKTGEIFPKTFFTLIGIGTVFWGIFIVWFLVHFINKVV